MTGHRIVVGYDGSDGARAALGWALDEAARTRTDVHLVYAHEWPVYAAAPFVPGIGAWPDEQARATLRAMLDGAAAAAAQTHPLVDLSREVVLGGPVPTLVDRSRHARLLVLGNRGHGGFAELLLGSVGVGVSAHAHCPVVVVRAEGRQPHPARHVVVGVDGSECAHRALAFAFETAAVRRVPLHVVRAVEPATPLWSTPGADRTGDLLAGEQAALGELVAGWQDKYPDVAVTSEVVADVPAATLVRASRNAQLAVVGSRGRGGFRGLLLGSVSQQLLHHGHCPVAVVRELPEEAYQPVG